MIYDPPVRVGSIRVTAVDLSSYTIYAMAYVNNEQMANIKSPEEAQKIDGGLRIAADYMVAEVFIPPHEYITKTTLVVPKTKYNL